MTPTQTLLAIAANQHFEGFGEGLLEVFIIALVLFALALFVGVGAGLGAIIGAICTPFPRKKRGALNGAIIGAAAVPVALIIGLFLFFTLL